MRALQDNDATMGGRKVARDLHSVFLNLSGREACDARHLAGVRSDDERAIASAEFACFAFEGIKPISVDDERQPALGGKQADEFRRIGVPRKAGADGDDRFVSSIPSSCPSASRAMVPFSSLRQTFGH